MTTTRIFFYVCADEVLLECIFVFFGWRWCVVSKNGVVATDIRCEKQCSAVHDFDAIIQHLDCYISYTLFTTLNGPPSYVSSMM